MNRSNQNVFLEASFRCRQLEGTGRCLICLTCFVLFKLKYTALNCGILARTWGLGLPATRLNRSDAPGFLVYKMKALNWRMDLWACSGSI